MHVLLADDQVSLRSALRLLLEHEPDIEVVGEVADANALPASTASLQPDLIFLDWELPAIKTMTAAKHLITLLHAIRPQIYIIALCTSIDTNRQPLTAGADAVVSKADPPVRLLTTLRQVVASKGARANGRL
jgi:DNA-binding NarL/FixJ family response regulator